MQPFYQSNPENRKISTKEDIYQDFELRWVEPYLNGAKQGLTLQHAQLLDLFRFRQHLNSIFSLGDDYWTYLRQRATARSAKISSSHYQRCMRAHDIIDAERQSWYYYSHLYWMYRDMKMLDQLVGGIAMEILIARGAVKQGRKIPPPGPERAKLAYNLRKSSNSSYVASSKKKSTSKRPQPVKKKSSSGGFFGWLKPSDSRSSSKKFSSGRRGSVSSNSSKKSSPSKPVSRSDSPSKHTTSARSNSSSSTSQKPAAAKPRSNSTPQTPTNLRNAVIHEESDSSSDSDSDSDSTSNSTSDSEDDDEEEEEKKVADTKKEDPAVGALRTRIAILTNPGQASPSSFPQPAVSGPLGASAAPKAKPGQLSATQQDSGEGRVFQLASMYDPEPSNWEKHT